jgi:hypothetical protein
MEEWKSKAPPEVEFIIPTRHDYIIVDGCCLSEQIYGKENILIYYFFSSLSSASYTLFPSSLTADMVDFFFIFVTSFSFFIH